MATSKRTRSAARLTVVLSASALAFGLLPGFSGTSQAEPTTPAPRTSQEAKQKVVALGDQLEIITEEFNAANIHLGEARTTQRQAEAKATALQAQMESLSGKVSQMASSVYRSVPLSEFTTLLTSSSPDQFLNQLSTLNSLSYRRDAMLTSLTAASKQADAARTTARQAAARAQQIFAGLQSKKSTIEQQLTQYTTLLNRLTAKERAEALAATPPPAERASRDEPRPPATTIPATGKAKVAVDAAMSRLGMPYVWAADGPSSFDCSGLTMWAWAQAGVSLPHQSAMQYDVGTHVSVNELLPGDLLFFYQPIHHVAMYIGNGQMVHAPTAGDVVKVAPIDMGNYTGATRIG